MAKILIEIISILFALAFALLVEKVRQLVNVKIGEVDDEETRETIRALVFAAEQQYKAMEKSGADKKDYVMHELVKLGYDITEYINALIEAEVYRLKE